MTPLYFHDFIEPTIATAECARLWDGLSWEEREGAPRREYWSNDFSAPYRYGNEEHGRTYPARAWDYNVRAYMEEINRAHEIALNCCFINGYAHQRQHLGWHADDSEEMSHDIPVAVVSLGAEREIWFRPKDDDKSVSKQMLGNGSLLIMPPGFQRLYQHRIPKADRVVGPRISLTYRGLLP
jgi:alkylated DNA repair dioxygenase AlkB